MDPPANHADKEGKGPLHGYNIVAEPFRFSKEVKTYTYSRMTTWEVAAGVTVLTVSLLIKCILFCSQSHIYQRNVKVMKPFLGIAPVRVCTA